MYLSALSPYPRLPLGFLGLLSTDQTCSMTATTAGMNLFKSLVFTGNFQNRKTTPFVKLHTFHGRILRKLSTMLLSCTKRDELGPYCVKFTKTTGLLLYGGFFVCRTL